MYGCEAVYHSRSVMWRFLQLNWSCTYPLVFLLQHEDECRCGNSYGAHGEADQSNCNTKCLGNRDQICGGAWRNSVYNINSGIKLWKWLEVGTVPTFKWLEVGTVPTFKRLEVGTLWIFKTF